MMPSGVFPPIMVCVFPLPVCPYAKIVAASQTPNRGATVANDEKSDTADKKKRREANIRDEKIRPTSENVWTEMVCV